MNWYEKNTYTHITDFLVIPKWECVSKGNDKIGLNDIVKNMIDTCCIESKNRYFKINYNQYLCGFVNAFENPRAKIDHDQYIAFVESLRSETNHDESSSDPHARDSKLVIEDNNFINELEKYTREKLMKDESEIVYEDDQYSVIVPLSYDSVRYHLRKTFSCFASRSNERYKGYIENQTMFFIINDNSPEHKTLKTTYLLKSSHYKPYHAYINKNGTPLCPGNYFSIVDDSPVEHLKLELLSNLRNKVDKKINVHFKENIDKYLNRVVTEPTLFKYE
mgnify:CR=1 FL=1